MYLCEMHCFDWLSLQDEIAWEPGVTMGGHFDSVQDLAWDPEGMTT